MNSWIFSEILVHSHFTAIKQPDFFHSHLDFLRPQSRKMALASATIQIGNPE